MAEIETQSADYLSRDDARALLNWTDCQGESLFADLTLQECLNVYHASSEYITFSDWLIEDEAAAVKAYNRAVKPHNKLR